jgi:formamidopyrimidine-DNA glycosylase
LPELPEVEAVRRRLVKDVAGREIVRTTVLRAVTTYPQKPAIVEARTAGRRIEAIRRRGKNLLLELSGDVVLHIHLRMTGNLYVVPDARLCPASARVVFELDGGGALIFDDKRALGKVQIHKSSEIARLFSKIGMEPLGPEFTVDALAAAMRGSRQPVKLFLLDQRHVAGLGNIYAAEALFRARIDPRKPANKIRRPKIEALHAAIVGVLGDAVQSACIAYASPGRYGEAENIPLGVYDRAGEACGICGRAIRRILQGGRSTYFCPGCQR